MFIVAVLVSLNENKKNTCDIRNLLQILSLRDLPKLHAIVLINV